MQFGLAFALLLAAWLLLCRQAGGLPAPACILPDVLPLVLGWWAALGVTGRPVAAAAGVAAIALGLAVTDAVKRATLREPLVFADRAELLEVVRHPRLYLPFAGPVRIVAGAAGAVLAAAALLWFEPPVGFSPAGPLAAALCAALPLFPPVTRALAAAYRRLGVTGEPAADMRRLGFLFCLVVHATLARQERPRRRTLAPPFPPTPATAGPAVLVQLESFFDARRMGAPVALPGWDRLVARATASGLLAVPCWGANTVRSEFAALTGIGPDILGLDRFNPYERFAQARTRSLAWQFKAAGYRTICLHPFDKRFYARDRVMPSLGFDEFRGMEAFAGHARPGVYVGDEAVAEVALRIVREEGPLVFVFAITMGNHGPWGGNGVDPLAAFLDGLRASDRAVAMLEAGMPRDGLLAVYGDHQPSLPAAFAAASFLDERTDFALCRPGAPRQPPAPLALEALPALVLGLQDQPG